jgi:thioesterase domain-containing protein
LYANIGVSLPSFLQLNDLTLFHYQMGRTHVSQPYPGKATVFLAKETPELSGEDARLGWSRLAAGGFEVYELDCSHDDMLSEPKVALLAQELAACISRASRRPQILPETVTGQQDQSISRP